MPVLTRQSQRTNYCTNSLYVKNFVRDADSLLKAIEQEVLYVPRTDMPINMYGRTVYPPRDKAFYSLFDQDGSYYLYRYTGKTVKPVEFTPTLEDVRRQVSKYCGVEFTHCVVNRYRNGSDYISMHRDKDRDFAPVGCICTIQLGATRPFKLEPQYGGLDDVRVDLEHGQMFVLSYKDNELYKHSIPKVQNVEQRISLTLRCIATRAND